MRKYLIISICVIFCLTFVNLVFSDTAFSQEAKTLKPFHKEAGLECKDCHNEIPAVNAVSGDVCLNCHGEGDRKKVLEMTSHMIDNPHEDHEGGLDCTECHYEHQVSKDHCVSCHSFGFKTP